MCTVTFIPSSEGVFLTSNRDEKSVRPAALFPEEYNFATGRLLFPKDRAAGGTWIAIHENGNAIVFLNGGIRKHIPQPPYRKSRGLVLLDLLDNDFPFQQFLSISLDGIEPFTAVIRDGNELWECRWDGNRKYHKAKSTAEPHIWSSVTLYTEDVIAKRQDWFRSWLSESPHPTQADILRFHQFTGDGDSWNDLNMNRDGETFTVSITSVKLGDAKASMTYLDLKSHQQTTADFAIDKFTGALK